MSRENVELVLRMFERPRDPSVAEEVFADDIVMRFHGELHVLGEDVVGKLAVSGWFVDWFRQFEAEYSFEVHEVEDWDDRVMVIATHHGRGRASGAPIAGLGIWVYAIRDGRIVTCDVYSDREQALAAAGRPG
jgi:ketosteroid isomerase-like protein